MSHAPAAPLGAHPTSSGVRFSVFSTTARTVEVRLVQGDGNESPVTHAMVEGEPGHFAVEVEGVGPGQLYTFLLDGEEVPDPYARFLPRGVHGPARVEPAPVPPQERRLLRPFASWVIYELHVGTFTAEGTYRAAIDKLHALVELGVDAIEIMPIAAFAGERGWGYDGVMLFAPHAPYGEPDDLRALVDAAHARGIAVILDVVYNHLGPAGNYLSRYAPEYFSRTIENAWGAAPDYGEPHMRQLVLDNARYWLEGFDIDGLRLDATHGIVDPSATHILAELAALAKSLPGSRVLIAEDDRNDPALVEQLGLDAVWADDFHHAVRVSLTRESDGYYAAYRGDVPELARVIRRGWLYEGDVYAPTGERRGKPATLPKRALVYCIQNHDQIGNRALGNRLTDDVDLSAYLGATALLLFLPSVPMLFMGQEWAATSPFLYFTDHEPELGALVTQGRRKEFAKFEAFRDPTLREAIPDPQARSTFERSKLDWGERLTEPHASVYATYRRLLELRRRDPVLAGETSLTVEVEQDLLVVTRRNEHGTRVLLYNPTDTAIHHRRLDGGAEVLHATAPADAPGLLPPRAAAILALREGLPLAPCGRMSNPEKDTDKATPSPDANQNGNPQPEGNDSPKGGSSLYSAGSKSVAAESTFTETKRDKDGKPLTPEEPNKSQAQPAPGK